MRRQRGDVLVVDLFGKIEDGTFIGDNLGTAIAARAGTGLQLLNPLLFAFNRDGVGIAGARLNTRDITLFQRVGIFP